MPGGRGDGVWLTRGVVPPAPPWALSCAIGKGRAMPSGPKGHRVDSGSGHRPLSIPSDEQAGA